MAFVVDRQEKTSKRWNTVAGFFSLKIAQYNYQEMIDHTPSVGFRLLDTSCGQILKTNVKDRPQVWDTPRPFAEYVTKLATYKDLHEHRTAYILGSGLSIGEIEGLNLLSDEITLAANLLFRWQDLPINPMYWCAAEEDTLRFHNDEIIDRTSKMGVTELFYANCRFPFEDVDRYQDWVLIPRHLDIRIDNENVHPGYGGTWTIRNGDYPAFTTGLNVVYDCMIQLAVWMGCDRIVLIGVDADHRGHVYGTPEYGGVANDYRSPFMKASRQQALINTLQVTREYLLEHFDIELVNASPSGSIELPRVDLEDEL